MNKQKIKTKESNFVSAVIYVKNAENQVEEFLQTINTILNNNFLNYEIICVNDGSHDSSVELIKKYARTTDPAMISILNMGVTQGLELSMDAGVDLTIGDFVFEFDSTHLDFPSELIMDIYYKSLEGYDIVSSCPGNCSPSSSKFFYRVYNKYSESPYKLKTERFRILSRRGINRIYSLSKTIPYRKALYANCGLKLSTINYTPIKANSKNNSNTKERRQLATDSLILFTNVAYRISLFMSFIMAVFAIAVGIYTVSTYLGQNKPVAGWTTTMLFLSVAFTGVFLLSGVIIKYLSLLINLTFKKQHYTIESIEKLTN